MAESLYPLLFTPVYKDYLWGGNRIPRRYGRDPSARGIFAESWEISDRREGMSVVSNGSLAGKTLRQLVRTRRREIVGRGARGARFPILIKIIDAKQRLSVQVHPDDRAAARWGGEAKTEMWHVLDAPRGAGVFAGLRPGADKVALCDAIRRGDKRAFEALMRFVPAVKGEAIAVPGGRVHAVGEGCLLLEIQQNSDTTYRVFDWGRVGADGRPRKLHVRQALRVMRPRDRSAVRIVPRTRGERATNGLCDVLTTPFFRVSRLALRRSSVFQHDGRSFHALFVTRGRVRVTAGTGSETLLAGTSCLIPAALTSYTLQPIDGPVEIIRAVRG